MIGKIITFITGFIVGTLFGWVILEKLLVLILERLVG